MVRKLKLLTVLSVMVAILATPALSSASINIGVLAPRGKLKSMNRWKDFATYMTEQLGQAVTIKPLPPAEVLGSVKNGSVDLVLTNPVHTVNIVQLHGGEPLATLNKKSGPVFAGVIVSKNGSGINRSEDLAGKKVMSLKFKVAAGAYTFQTYHLHQKGIDPHRDFASMVAGKKQDDLVLAVKAGVIDAAFVRSGILESMQKEGKISMDEFTIVDQRNDDALQQVHTTSLYPEWFLLSLPHTDKNIAEKAKQAALGLKADNPAAKTASIQGFVEPISLDDMINALKALKISPFDN
jgi:ABC-type phosphate/phosphonate transport system substrate-binding protein